MSNKKPTHPPNGNRDVCHEVAKLFKDGAISITEAAHMAQMPLKSFIKMLHPADVPCIEQDPCYPNGQMIREASFEQPTAIESRYVDIEADMLARATRRVMHSGDYVEAAQLAILLGANDITSQQLKLWAEKGMIFFFSHLGADYYPLYGFVRQPQFLPHPAVSKIITIFEKKDGWRLAFWFSSVNGYLDGMRPQDVLASEPDCVIAAAKRQVEGIQHG